MLVIVQPFNPSPAGQEPEDGVKDFPMRAITVLRAEHIPLARLSGVNIEAIRYYERIKMLPAP